LYDEVKGEIFSFIEKKSGFIGLKQWYKYGGDENNTFAHTIIKGESPASPNSKVNASDVTVLDNPHAIWSSASVSF
jgi:hypothetical protein